MKLSKFTVILAVLLISIMAIGAVSAESVDDSGAIAIDDGGEVQESIADDVGDLGTADTADLAVNDEGGAVLGDEAASYDLNDDSYSTYFNDDGTAKDTLSADGDYTLNVGNLTNKDIKITSGSNINITAKEGEGFINNGTIYIDGGFDGLAGSITISGLTFTNTNKGAVDIAAFCTDITIKENTINIIGDNATASPSLYSVTAITPNGNIYGLNIIDNKITVTGDHPYLNGIYSGMWPYPIDNPSDFNISGNTIYIEGSSTTGSNAAIVVESNNLLIDNNDITVKSIGDAFAYGIQVSDYGYTVSLDTYSGYQGDLASSNNIKVGHNNVNLDTEYMAYGISVINFGANGLYTWYDFPVDIDVSNNTVSIKSKKGVMGIVGQVYNMTVANNDLTIIGGSSEGLESGDMLGVGSYALGAQFNAGGFEDFLDDGSLINMSNNKVLTNVIPEFINDADEYEDYVTFDNEITIIPHTDDGEFIVTEESYSLLFDENGNLKDILPDGSTLLLGDLTNKKMTIGIPIIIKPLAEDSTLTNSTIHLVQGADNSVIDGLTMEFTGDETTGSIGIIYITDVTNVTISNNKITVPNFVNKPSSSWGSSVYAIEVESAMFGCKDIVINSNDINLQGTCNYLYGVDAFSWGMVNTKNILIFENKFSINGGARMAEAIYVSGADGAIIDGNIINSISDGAAYGIATDQLTNAMITSNDITTDAGNMAYAITVTTSGSDNTVRGNDINAKGTGAVGIGVNYQNGITIEDNTIAIDGGNYTSITSSDNLGTANAGILVGEGNTNVKSSGNDVTEVSAVRLNTTIVVSDLTVTAAPSGNGTLQFTLKTTSGMVLANQVVKVVFNNQMYELTTNANGVAKLSFALNKAGTYNVEFFYLGDDNYRGSDATAKIKINKIATKTTSAAKTYLATASSKAISATLKDAKGNLLANKKVTFTVNGKTYSAKTNNKGVATVKLALTAAKTYTVSIKFAGDNVYAASTVSAKVKLNKEATKINAPAKTFKRKAKTKKVVITLKNSKNKVVANKKVVLTVNKKNYTVKTNKKGQATFNIKLTKKGTFKYTVKFAGDSQYKAVKKTGKIKIK